MHVHQYLVRASCEITVPQSIYTHQFDNGLALVAESMDWLESAAFSLLLPAGCVADPHEKLGVSNFTCEMVQRGCGERNSREFVEALETLGVLGSANVTNAHTSFGGAMPADKIYDALSIYADVVRKPQLPLEQFEDARLVCLQELRALEDELPQQLMAELRRLHYGDPLGRSREGTFASVEQIAPADVEQFFADRYRPNGAILSVAGKIDWDRLVEHVGELWGDWQAAEMPAVNELPPQRGYHHLSQDSTQTHIGIAYPNVPSSHPDFYRARGAIGVLSDGMSSRLFLEVREKRGLCYSVHASCHSLRDRGSVLCYSGTTTDRAQETMDVILSELHRLSEGIEEAELNRLKTKIKSLLIIQQESSSSRSGSIAGDWYHLGRVRTLDELNKILDDLSAASINEYLAANPPRDFTIVTLGENPLEAPLGVPTANT